MNVQDPAEHTGAIAATLIVDADNIAVGILEPGEVLAAELCDPLNGLQLWKVEFVEGNGNYRVPSRSRNSVNTAGNCRAKSGLGNAPRGPRWLCL
jgi:hypothetical protein